MLRCQPSPQSLPVGQGALRPYVTYVDPDGKEQWLFDGFIFLESQDVDRPDSGAYSYMTGVLRDAGVSAGKEQWQELIDYYFTKGNCADALEQAVKEATARLGKAPCKRRVIIMIPDPIIHRHYIDTTTTTTYWGELGGRRLDFNSNEDRVAACRWYIDQVRARFAQGDYKYIDLAGFYWIREIAAQPHDTEYSYHLTRSDILLPRSPTTSTGSTTRSAGFRSTTPAAMTTGANSASTRSTCSPTTTGSRKTTWIPPA